MQYPMTMNYICETSPEEHWLGEEVQRASLWTSSAFFFSFAISTGLYAVRSCGAIASFTPSLFRVILAQTPLPLIMLL